MTESTFKRTIRFYPGGISPLSLPALIAASYSGWVTRLGWNPGIPLKKLHQPPLILAHCPRRRMQKADPNMRDSCQFLEDRYLPAAHPGAIDLQPTPLSGAPWYAPWAYQPWLMLSISQVLSDLSRSQISETVSRATWVCLFAVLAQEGCQSRSCRSCTDYEKMGLHFGCHCEGKWRTADSNG